MENEA